MLSHAWTHDATRMQTYDLTVTSMMVTPVGAKMFFGSSGILLSFDWMHSIQTVRRFSGRPSPLPIMRIISNYASGGYAVGLRGFGMVWVWGLVLRRQPRQELTSYLYSGFALAQGALGCWCSCVVAFGYLLPKKVRTTNQTLFMTRRNCTNQKQNSAKKNVRTIVMRTCGPQALLLLNHQTGKLSSYGFGLQCLDWFCYDFKNESKDWLGMGPTRDIQGLLCNV